jgi:hypothetical protein
MNRCDYFSPAEGAGEEAVTQRDQTRDALENLFRKK